MVLRILLILLIGLGNLSLGHGMTWSTSPTCVADSGIKITVEGKVFDRQTEQAVAAQLSYELVSEATAPQPVKLDPATGAFSLELAAGAVYRFTIEAEGYFPMVKRIDLTEAGPEDRVTLSLNLKAKPKPNRVVPADPFGTLLTIVYFKGSSVELTDESRAELDRLLKLLRANPDTRLSVQGHADIKGSFERNMRLADLRTQAVRAYLMAHDVAPYRLPSIAYGNAFMMTTFPEDRRLNNRVEFHFKLN
jgi:OmpA-OmpF porin, OOP family